MKTGGDSASSSKGKKNGFFCISLDFEMFWGLQDATTIKAYGKNILDGKSMIPEQLALFTEFGIHATWGVVGFLLAHNKEELLRYAPNEKPTYSIARRNPYRRFAEVGESEEESPYYYARPMVDRVIDAPNQKLGSHTFSHYYCNEAGQTLSQFEADMQAAVNIAVDTAYAPLSLVLPRNQCNDEYLSVCAKLGFTCYRSEEDNWIYRNVKKEFWLRALRYLDSYFPLSGSNAHKVSTHGEMWDIPGSAFLRPFEPRLRVLEPLKIWRIKGQMLYAAKHGLVYHLYWHPHNLGGNGEKSLSAQRKLFAYYKELNQKYGFESINMEELTVLSKA